MGNIIKLENDNYIANNLYLDKEIVIGKWINGKPIYRKVITGTLNSSGSMTLLSNCNIDTFVNAGGYALGTDSNHRFMLNAYEGEMSNLLRLFITGTQNLIIQFGSMFYNKKFEFWIEYTKK